VSLILDEHRQYLADEPRLDAFERALRQVARPGAVVLDLASGTGVLGMLALRAGASRVYAIEAGGIIDIARRLAQANGVADRITFIHGLSTRVELPERVDVIVGDMTGRLGIEAGAFEFLLDARRRFLLPAGAVIPCGLEFEVAALESDDLRSRLDFWRTTPAGLDVAAAQSVADNTGYPALVAPGQLLSAPQRVAQASLPPERIEPIAGQATIEISRAGRLDGLSAWCRVELAPGVRMTNSPLDPRRIHRRQVMLPLQPAVDVRPGDRLSVWFHLLPADRVVTWRVELTGSAGSRRFAHTTFTGMLLTGEDRILTDPQWIPRLTPAGAARRTVLELCDGERPLRDIEAEVYRRHASLLPTPDDASVFVAEVLAPYGLIDRAHLPRR
jgi:protein arginine N-methyltransferase 1